MQAQPGSGALGGQRPAIRTVEHERRLHAVPTVQRAVVEDANDHLVRGLMDDDLDRSPAGA